MKIHLSMFLFVLLAIASCKKDKQPATILLSKITSPDGPATTSFNYNGKQLLSVVYNYPATANQCHCTTNYTETVTFNYDGQGKLTGTTIISTQPNYAGDVNSVITYAGNNISDVKFYKSGNLPDRDITITYQNGNVAGYLITPYNNSSITTPQTVTFSYDSANHNITEQQTDAINGKQVVTNSGFDSRPGLSGAVPFWVYFNAAQRNLILNTGAAGVLFGIPGVNNPVNMAFTQGALAPGSNTLSYQYNGYGYPSSISYGADQSAYTYEYIAVP